MNPFLSFIIRILVAIPVSMIVWPISFFAFDQPFLLTSALSIAGGTLGYWFTGIAMKAHFLRKNQLTSKEYRYIKKNLDEAERKIIRLSKTLFSIRNIPSLKQRIDVVRISRKIFKLTQREPKRFYQAERFYFSHLDSLVELTEKYAFLAGQPKRSQEMEQLLMETRQTLNGLAQLLEEDLYEVISNDVDDLNFEMDVAKHSINKK